MGLFESSERVTPPLNQILYDDFNESRLFQQPIHFDFTSGAEIDAPVHHDRDNKTCGQRGTVALAVLFGAIEGLAEFSGIEGVKDRGDVRTLPRFRSDGPDD